MKTANKDALQMLINAVDDSIQAGVIKGKIFDMQKHTKYIAANELGLLLAINPKDIEIECKPSMSFAMTTFICDLFGFGITNNEEDTKERYQDFLCMIDYLSITAGPKPTEITVSFSVNDVWKE